jgi:hypothetical protein
VRDVLICTIGRLGDPSDFKKIIPLVTAQATRLLRTISKRMRGETPYAVAGRIPGLLCQLGEAHAGAIIDLVSDLGP